MTLKTKKISLGALAAISIVAVPVVTVVSCGSETKDDTHKEEKIDWVQQALKTEPSKEMVFNDIDAKNKTVDFVKKMIWLLAKEWGAQELEFLKTEMDDASNADFPIFANNAKSPFLSKIKLITATNDDLKRIFNGQVDFIVKYIVEKLALKTIIFNFSDKTTFKLTFTDKEQDDIRKSWGNELKVFKDVYNLDYFKMQRSFDQAKKVKNTRKTAKIKKLLDVLKNKSKKIRDEGSKVNSELKSILEKHVTDVFNKK